MALPAGRVGVKRTDVDWKGNVKNGGSSDTYTKQQIDSKFGGLTFRDNEGTPQVKTSGGEWVNFNSGGGIGFSIPADKLITTGINIKRASIESGGYCIDNGVCYFDITFIPSDIGSIGDFIELPVSASAEALSSKPTFYTSLTTSNAYSAYLFGNSSNGAYIGIVLTTEQTNKSVRIYGNFNI